MGSRWHIYYTFVMNKKTFNESLTQDVNIGALKLSIEDAIELGRKEITKKRNYIPSSEELVTAELVVKAFPDSKEELKKIYFYYVYFSYFNQPVNGVDQPVQARMIFLPDGTRLFPESFQQQRINN